MTSLPDTHLTRRRLLGAAALTATATAVAAVPLAGSARAAAPTATAATATAPTAVRGTVVRLPAPTGPCLIGTTALHLVDRSRRDPWVPAVAHREVMVSIWYPAAPGSESRPLAPHMTPGAAKLFDQVRAPGFNIPAGTVDWSATRTHAHLDATPDTRGGRRPVVLYSAGAGDPRTWGTAHVEELASRGYVVVTLDHTYDSPAVEFPDGSVTSYEPVMKAFEEASRNHTEAALLEKLVRVRVADIRFLMDRLMSSHALPLGLSKVLDTRRVGMFGQSAGGITTAQAMYHDRRIKAGIDFDGTLEYNPDSIGTNLMPVARHGLSRPLMLMGHAGVSHNTTELSWKAFWENTPGWKRDLTLRNSAHQSFTDLEALMPQSGLPQRTVEGEIGGGDPERSVLALRTYVNSFFDRWLRHRDNHLLDGPSAGYPEFTFAE